MVVDEYISLTGEPFHLGQGVICGAACRGNFADDLFKMHEFDGGGVEDCFEAAEDLELVLLGLGAGVHEGLLRGDVCGGGGLGLPEPAGVVAGEDAGAAAEKYEDGRRVGFHGCEGGR